jgi:hypothetical protein
VDLFGAATHLFLFDTIRILDPSQLPIFRFTTERLPRTPTPYTPYTQQSYRQALPKATMKISVVALTFLSGLSSSLAFSVNANKVVHHHNHAPLSSSRLFSSPMMDQTATEHAVETVLGTAKQLKSEYGVFIIDKGAKKELERVVSTLESTSEPPSPDTYREHFLGDWTLLCTTAVGNEGVDTKSLPFLNTNGPIKSIRDSIKKTVNKYLTVQQKIRSEGYDGEIDRVDHVLEYQPPEELQEVLDNLPEQLTSLNINPLHVSKSKLVLVHKASVESVTPLKTKLNLKSIVLNVAGTSTFLEPDGKDVAGINFPLGEFLQTGTFETTYMDRSLRISRGKLGLVDQLRIFERTNRVKKEQAYQEIIDSDVSLGQGVDAGMDVDEVVDPGFADDEQDNAVEAPSDVETSFDDTVDVNEIVDPEFTDEDNVEAPSDVEASFDDTAANDVDDAVDEEITDEDDSSDDFEPSI